MSSHYTLIEEKFARIHHLQHLLAITNWDEAVMMPAGGGHARAEATADCKALITELLHAPEWSDLFQAAEQESSELSPWQKANLREAKREWKLANAVPPDLVAASSRASSRCEQAWRSMRANNDWDALRPLLEEVVDHIREEADVRAAVSGQTPYNAMIDLYEPGETAEELEQLFGKLKAFLPSFIQEVLDKQQTEELVHNGSTYEVAKQEALGREIMAAMGFNFERGRLDVSHHPFCGGVPQDTRITTRYSTEDFSESLMGVIHETGHACYEQGLPADWIQQPVGSARGMGLHESQSLLFEMQMGRSPEFMHFMQPLVEKQFGESPVWEINNLKRLYTRVERSLIRVNADEVTYPLHVILRFELERDLISRKMEVRDLPEAWNSKMEEYLGLSTTGNDRDGCMQDVHWVCGLFGYFPSYTLGAILAAQLFDAAKRTHPGIPDDISQGKFDQIRSWLQENVWSQASYHDSHDLIMKATGEPLNSDHFIAYLKRRYL